MRILLVVLIIVAFILVSLPVLISSGFVRKLKIPGIVNTNKLNPTPALDDPKMDRTYSLVLTQSPKTIQVQGQIEGLDATSLNIKTTKDQYPIGINKDSAIECRDKYITLPNEKPIPAYAVYIDMFRYIPSLKVNKETFIKQGKLFLYKDAYTRTNVGSMVAALVDVSKEGKYSLNLLLVYGCQ